MSDIAIKVENLDKKYRIGLKKEKYKTISGEISNFIKSPLNNFKRLRSLKKFDDQESDDVLWALRDVSFEIKRGEAVGIIGRNGAGKSTLLKILSRITVPTNGRITINGRVASLLEVGTGFNPELTGRENIFLNGTILGMTRREIDRKLDEIIDFSGVEKFIDTPVKRYSSGMYVRLAFAVAAHLEPEILIIDEVLAVGDAEFQKKCLGKMDEVAKGGRTVLFVSHNMDAIKNLCQTSLQLHNGNLILFDNTKIVIDNYLSKTLTTENINNRHLYNGDGCLIKNTQLYFNGKTISNGDELIIRTEFKSNINRKYSIILYVFRQDQLSFAATSFYKEGFGGLNEILIEIKLPKYLLNPGFHSIDISMVDETGNQFEYLKANGVLYFNVSDDGYRRGGKYNKNWEGSVCPILEITQKHIK